MLLIKWKNKNKKIRKVKAIALLLKIKYQNLDIINKWEKTKQASLKIKKDGIQLKNHLSKEKLSNLILLVKFNKDKILHPVVKLILLDKIEWWNHHKHKKIIKELNQLVKMISWEKWIKWN